MEPNALLDSIRSNGNFKLTLKGAVDRDPSLVYAKWQDQKTGFSVLWMNHPHSGMLNSQLVVPFNEDPAHVAGLVADYLSKANDVFPKHATFFSELCNLNGCARFGVQNATDSTRFKLDGIGNKPFVETICQLLDQLLFPHVLFFAHEQCSFNTTNWSLLEDYLRAEVHHIDGSGKEGGKAWVTALAKEFKAENQIAKELSMLTGRTSSKDSHQAAYEQLRGLTRRTFEAFHSSSYHPSTMTLILLGPPTLPEEFFSSFKHLGQNFHGQSPIHKQVPEEHRVLHKSLHRVVHFASNAALGQLEMYWPTEILPQDYLDRTAAEAIMESLITREDGYLNKSLVQTGFCKRVTGGWSSSEPNFLRISLDGVLRQDLSKAAGELSDLLLKWKPESMDKHLTYLESMEITTSQDHTTSWAYAKFLQEILQVHAPGENNLQGLLNIMNHIETLKSWNFKQWSHLFTTVFAQHSITIQALPSHDIHSTMIKKNENYLKNLKNNIEDWDEWGVTQQRKLTQAQERLEGRIPAQRLEKYAVHHLQPQWRPLQEGHLPVSHQASPLQSSLEKEDVHLVWQTSFYKRRTPFITLYASLQLPPDGLSQEQMNLLPLLRTLILDLPTFFEGKPLDVHQVKKAMGHDLIAPHFLLGSNHNEHLILHIRVTQAKYEEGVKWLRATLWDSYFTDERVEYGLAQLALQDVTKDAVCLAQDAIYGHTRTSNGLSHTSTALEHREMLRQLKMLTHAQLVAGLRKLKDTLMTPAHVHYGVVGDLEKVSHLVGILKTDLQLERQQTGPKLEQPLPVSEILSQFPSEQISVYLTTSSTAGHAIFVAKAPSPSDLKSCAAVTAACYFLTQSLNQDIEASGIASSAFFSYNYGDPFVSLTVKETTDPHAGWSIAAHLLRKYENPHREDGLYVTKVDRLTGINVATAKLMELEDDKFIAAQRMFYNTAVYGFPSTVQHDVQRHMATLTTEDIHDALTEWIAPLAHPAKSFACIAIGQEEHKADWIEAFRHESYHVEVAKFPKA